MPAFSKNPRIRHRDETQPIDCPFGHDPRKMIA